MPAWPRLERAKPARGKRLKRDQLTGCRHACTPPPGAGCAQAWYDLKIIMSRCWQVSCRNTYSCSGKGADPEAGLNGIIMKQMKVHLLVDESSKAVQPPDVALGEE
jgi:hypothetical protein